MSAGDESTRIEIVAACWAWGRIERTLQTAIVTIAAVNAHFVNIEASKRLPSFPHGIN
jgi:hypothetical protein